MHSRGRCERAAYQRPEREHQRGMPRAAMIIAASVVISSSTMMRGLVSSR